MKRKDIQVLNEKIVNCKKCPRLAVYIEKVAKHKVKRFSEETYWGRPLTGFGDPNAELLVVGLAPAAHGGNRTGRMFTGDSSADWLALVLYEKGFATKPISKKVGDGFNLINAYITAAVRCAPPQNKPLKEELQNCSPYLIQELSILRNVRIIICLGRIAFDSCCKALNLKNKKFFHGNMFKANGVTIISSYHPSRQNTQTGRLKWNQWQDIFYKAREILDSK